MGRKKYLMWKVYIKHLYRRRIWVLHGLNLYKFNNLVKILISLMFQSRKVHSLPFTLKIDTTPNCQLKCLICNFRENGSLRLKNTEMSTALFEKIVKEVKGVTSALSLYYLGEPFMNKDTLSMVETASHSKFSIFISSNFSFNFKNKEIERLVDSGLTSLTVCIDGMTQDIYERTRRGGKLDFVLNNLKNVQQYKLEKHHKFPLVEIQFLKYPHNEHQIPEAKRYAFSIGIKDFTVIKGTTNTWEEGNAARDEVPSQKKSFIPRCVWPWTSMVILWNGDVIPCCKYRFDEQFKSKAEQRYILGNINDQTIRDIWNSKKYQLIRSMVSAPYKFIDKKYNNIFCYGCRFIYD